MGCYFPVFFFPISRNELPENLENWHSVEHILKLRLETETRSNLRISRSRNWWHQHATHLLCEGLAIKGLGFIQLEVVCLGEKELHSAANALDKLVERIKSGIPNLDPEIEKQGSIFYLRRYMEGDREKEFPVEAFQKAFDESQPTYEIGIDQDHGYWDHGYKALVGFYSFIKSLRHAIAESLDQDKCLLYVQPQ